jgi:Protein of unknown function (DUF3489)
VPQKEKLSLMDNTTLERQTSAPSKDAAQTVAPATKVRAVKNASTSPLKKGAIKMRATRTAKLAVARHGSKTAKILDLLKRPDGASLKELLRATGWQPHSVRGFLSGTLKKRMAIRLQSFKRKDGERAYRTSAK